MREGTRSPLRKAFYLVEEGASPQVRAGRLASLFGARAHVGPRGGDGQGGRARTRATAVVPNGVDTEYFTPGRDADRAADDRLQRRPRLPPESRRRALPGRRGSAARPRDASGRACRRRRPRRPRRAAARSGGRTSRRPARCPTSGRTSRGPRSSPCRSSPGSGTRFKVVEGLAMSKPMVSTAVGCEGIGVEDGRHLLIADTPEAFASAIVRLFDDADSRRVARAGGTGVRRARVLVGSRGRTAPGALRRRAGSALINLAFHGIGTPERELEPDEEQYWVDADLFEELLDAARGPARGAADVRRRQRLGPLDRPADAPRARSDRGLLRDRRAAGPARLAGRRRRPCAGRGRDDDRDARHAAPPLALARRARGTARSSTRRESCSRRRPARASTRRRARTARTTAGPCARLKQREFRRVYSVDRRPARPDAWFQPRYVIRRGDTASTVRGFGRDSRPRALVLAAKTTVKRWR